MSSQTRPVTTSGQCPSAPIQGPKDLKLTRRLDPTAMKMLEQWRASHPKSEGRFLRKREREVAPSLEKRREICVVPTGFSLDRQEGSRENSPPPSISPIELLPLSKEGEGGENGSASPADKEVDQRLGAFSSEPRSGSSLSFVFFAGKVQGGVHSQSFLCPPNDNREEDLKTKARVVESLGQSLSGMQIKASAKQ